MTLESSLFPPSSVNILAFLSLVCFWLQPTRKLSENCQFVCIRLSRLWILLLLSTNEPVVVNSCHSYDAKLNSFISSFFSWLCIKLYVHPFMKGHGLYMNKTSINQSINQSVSLSLSLSVCLSLSLSVCLSLSLSLSLCLSVSVSLFLSVCLSLSLSLSLSE